MKYGMNARYARLACLFGAVAAGAIPAMAQNENLEELEAYVVTGSLIPTAGGASAVPVKTITAAQIADTGISGNVLEIIQKSSPQFVGSGNLGSSNANIASGSTGGGSQLSLRNTNTLVLVNGRRVVQSPISGTGGYEFVDVNQIPVAAIDRIEILTDGASALYGTDATAGVVNIILKDNFEGGQVGLRFGYSDNTGHYQERKAWASVGSTFGGTTNITVTAEWSKQDPLFQYERGFSNPAYGTPTFAGVFNIGNDYYYLAPGLDAPPAGNATPAELVAAGIYLGPFTPAEIGNNTGAAEGYGFNLSNYVTLLMENEKKIFVASASHEFSDSLELFADFMYSDVSTFSQINAQPLGVGGVPADYPYNPTNATVVVRNRFVEYPRQYFYDTESFRILGGLRGNITETLRFEVAANHNKSDQDYRNPGVVDPDLFYEATGLLDNTAGPINLFSRAVPADVVASSGMFGEAWSKFTSELTTFDATVNGELFEMPAGTLKFAFGVEHRIDKLSGTVDPLSMPDPDGFPYWLGATTLQPFSAKRDVTAFFGELQIPVIDRLTASLAGRYEKYSDTDDPFVPKVGLRYEVLEDELVLRGSWGESFHAPSLYSMFGPTDAGFSSPISMIPYGDTVSQAWGQSNFRGGSNPNLEPTESESWTAGIVYTPKFASGLSLSVTYWNITEDKLVSSVPTATIAQDVETNGAASPYVDMLRFGAWDGARATAPGQVFAAVTDDVFITSPSINIATQELDGVDFELSYSADFDFGGIDFTSSWTWFNEYMVQVLPTDDPVKTDGYATDLNGTIPEWRVYNTLTFRTGKMSFTLGQTFIPRMPYEFSPSEDDRMETYVAWDAAVAYSFGDEVPYLNGLRLRLGVNNFTNEMPPLAPNLYSEANADVATYNPIGRMFFIDATYNW